MFIPLNIPEVPIDIRNYDSGPVVFDPIRKKELVLTPEEWVRQHFLLFLIRYLGYPKSLIKMESGLSVGLRMAKRSDILVVNSEGKPLLVVECKATDVKITDEVLNQAIQYNKTYQAKNIVLTNGLNHFSIQWDEKKSRYLQIKEIPAFKGIL